ncbi:MAG TPA: ATP-binding cassette domain-containing protein [Jatrophihabitans sp.]|jgi:ABC-type lipoprotein export system ATPase subunit|uniref:ABC transporter ATP-binding protein n=1 Tax=Jatrophihabitans sp. TaxID=1932789 RepID=UPI002E044D61|nr:ATP-binding cassette domain-containing protein [Jatrophihabitans sp.]
MTVIIDDYIVAEDQFRSGGLAVSAHQLVHIYRVEGNDVVALTSVDLDIAAGQMVALLGPSGSGKSTMLTLLAGLHQPSAGRLRVGTHNLSNLEPKERDALRATEVGTVLQGAARNLLPYATPEQNVAFAQAAAVRLGKSVPEPRAILDLVGMVEHARRRLRELTPGQLQTVAVAVAISALPGLLLADEPTSQLDHEHRDDVLDAITRINRQIGTTVLLVTHDPEVAARMPRRITIRDGRIGSEGHGTEELAVIGRDGSLQLPPDILEGMPAGSLLRVRRLPGGEVMLERIDGDRS